VLHKNQNNPFGIENEYNLLRNNFEPQAEPVALNIQPYQNPNLYPQVPGVFLSPKGNSAVESKNPKLSL
jgi:hypothetical protein